MLGRRLACLLLVLASLAARAEAEELGLKFVETQDAKLIYFEELEHLAPLAIRTFTNSLAWQRRTFDWKPTEATTILLKDFADYGNAVTWAAPRNTEFFEIEPLSFAFESFPASERMYSLMNHELIHVVQSDIANSDDRRWRSFFLGKVAAHPQNPETLLYGFLTNPRFARPRWWAEGGAVFMETWMGGGIGRAQGGYDEMVFRAMVREGARFHDPLGLESVGFRTDFQTTVNAYLYGTRFFTWLAHTYSPQKAVEWIRRDEASRRTYADQFEHVFGLPLETAWKNWIAFEKEFQTRNLARVREHPTTAYQVLTPTALGSISRLYYDEATAILYGAFIYPGVVSHVGALNTRDGTVRRLVDIKGALLYRVTSFAFDPKGGTAFYTDYNLGWRDLMAVNVKTGEGRVLLKHARIGEMVFNPVDRSLLGVRHDRGLASLVRIPYPYDDWKVIHTFPYGRVPYDLDISPDGRRLSASMSDVGGEQYVRVWELDKVLSGDMRPLSEFRFGQSVPESFVFSKDGKYLFGSSYYTGVSNIFRYEVATGQVEAVSNAESGFFRPLPLADGRLVVLTYTSAGFVPAIIEPKPVKDVSAITFLGNEVASKHPVVTTWQVPPPSTVDEQKLITRTGDYYPPANLGLVNGYPVLQGYKKYAGAGYRMNFEDPIGFARLSVTAAFTPTTSLSQDERAHVLIDYSYLDWKASLAWNRSDFYDLFGPTLRSRRGFAATLDYGRLLIFEEPRRLEWKSEVAFYSNLDALPASQNVGATSPRLATAETGLFFTEVRRSIGAVDDEKGWKWDAVLSTSQAGEKNYPKLRGSVDYGIALPLRNSSIWLRTAGGIASGDRTSPYTNFYFGGFGNNYVDSRTVKRYREYDSFPGFEIDEIGGRSFARALVEWNLPPVGFESIGKPAFHLRWLRPALFASTLWTDPGDASLRSRFGSVGTQIDLNFSVLHYYDMTLSAGFAIGYRGGQRKGDEWMISLKIM